MTITKRSQILIAAGAVAAVVVAAGVFLSHRNTAPEPGHPLVSVDPLKHPALASEIGRYWTDIERASPENARRVTKEYLEAHRVRAERLLRRNAETWSPMEKQKLSERSKVNSPNSLPERSKDANDSDPLSRIKRMILLEETRFEKADIPLLEDLIREMDTAPDLVGPVAQDPNFFLNLLRAYRYSIGEANHRPAFRNEDIDRIQSKAIEQRFATSRRSRRGGIFSGE